jgi:hypothetical protein
VTACRSPSESAFLNSASASAIEIERERKRERERERERKKKRERERESPLITDSVGAMPSIPSFGNDCKRSARGGQQPTTTTATVGASRSGVTTSSALCLHDKHTAFSCFGWAASRRSLAARRLSLCTKQYIYLMGSNQKGNKKDLRPHSHFFFLFFLFDFLLLTFSLLHPCTDNNHFVNDLLLKKKMRKREKKKRRERESFLPLSSFLLSFLFSTASLFLLSSLSVLSH